jgi:WD40 repeat protein
MMGALQVWELNPAAPLVGVPLEVGPAKSFTFSPDGHWIGAVDDDSARLIDRATGRTERHYEHGRMMCFDARSQRVAIVSDNRQPVVIEDVQSGKELWQKYVPETQTICYDANFDPQGELLVASGCWEKCRVWKPATDETVWEDPVEVSYPIPDFSDDGRTMSVVSADSQRSASDVFLWELPSGRKITQFKCADYVLQCEVSPNHRWAAITSTRLLADRTFKLTEKTRLATTGIHADRPKPLSTVTVLRLPEGSKHATIEFGAGVTMVSFNPHDGLLACTTEDAMVHLWRLDESAEILRLKPPRKPERAAATFTPDGRCLAWCSQRGRGQAMHSTMHFLDLPELQRQLTNIGFGW